jgi:hypothetical protein
MRSEIEERLERGSLTTDFTDWVKGLALTVCKNPLGNNNGNAKTFISVPHLWNLWLKIPYCSLRAFAGKSPMAKTPGKPASSRSCQY